MQALLTVFAETTTGGNRREMENAKRFLDQQIETYATQLRAAEQRRAEFREKYMQLLPAADGAASQLEAGRAVVERLKLEVDDARAKRDSLKAEFDATPKVISVDSNAPQVIIAGKPVGARARLAEARARLEEWSTPLHAGASRHDRAAPANRYAGGAGEEGSDECRERVRPGSRTQGGDREPGLRKGQAQSDGCRNGACLGAAPAARGGEAAGGTRREGKGRYRGCRRRLRTSIETTP